MAERAGSGARGGGHVPFQSRPRGQPKRSPDLGGGTGKPRRRRSAGPRGDTLHTPPTPRLLPAAPGGGLPRPRPARGHPRGRGATAVGSGGGGPGGVRTRSLGRGRGKLVSPRGAAGFGAFPGAPQSGLHGEGGGMRGGGGGGLGAAGAPVCLGFVCLFAVWPLLYFDQARLPAVGLIDL